MKKLFLILIFISSFLIFGVAGISASNTSGIKGPDLIQKEQYQILTLSDILSFYSSDQGAIAITEDNYSGNGAVLGQHIIELGVTGTEIRKEITVEVITQIGYNVRAVTNQKDIHIAKNDILKPADMVQIHHRTGLFVLNHTSQMSILSDAYTSKSNVPGVYLFEYRIMDASGLDKVISFTITVHDSERLETPIILIPKQPGFGDQLTNLLEKIGTVLFLAVVVFVVIAVYKKSNRRNY